MTNNLSLWLSQSLETVRKTLEESIPRSLEILHSMQQYEGSLQREEYREVQQAVESMRICDPFAVTPYRVGWARQEFSRYSPDGQKQELFKWIINNVDKHPKTEYLNTPEETIAKGGKCLELATLYVALLRGLDHLDSHLGRVLVDHRGIEMKCGHNCAIISYAGRTPVYVDFFHSKFDTANGNGLPVVQQLSDAEVRSIYRIPRKG